jgi:malonyl-CoA O-methyltransferase
MLPTAPEPVARRGVDAIALAHQLRRLMRAEQAPWLHGEVARRMGERLAVIRSVPRQLIDWQAPLSASGALLRARYPRASVVAVDSERRSAAPATRRWWPLAGRQAAAITPEQVVPGGAELVWANMALHSSPDPQALFARWHAALAVDGFLMFSTLGPGTLVELAALYRRQGWPPPMAPFVDMHDLGDMLVEAGFADPVMDQETLTLSWADAQSMLTELRSLGGNANPARFGGLRTPAWRQRLCAALAETAKADGRPSLSFEIVYGHAFRVAPKLAVAAETRLSPQALQAMARSGAKRGGRGERP